MYLKKVEFLGRKLQEAGGEARFGKFESILGGRQERKGSFYLQLRIVYNTQCTRGSLKVIQHQRLTSEPRQKRGKFAGSSKKVNNVENDKCFIYQIEDGFPCSLRK